MESETTALSPRVKGTPRALYAFDLASRPSAWGTTLVGTVLVITMDCAIVLVPFAFLMLAALWMAAGSTRVRRRLDRDARRRAVLRGRDARETRLEDARVSCSGLYEATSLVDRIADADPSAPDLYELEALLDRYADVAIALARCHSITQSTNRYSMGYSLDAARSSTRRALLERRIECFDQCRERARDLQDELAGILDFLDLLAQRTALTRCRLEIVDEDALDVRLAQLDSEEAAEPA
jgi:hypothetical protein